MKRLENKCLNFILSFGYATEPQKYKTPHCNKPVHLSYGNQYCLVALAHHLQACRQPVPHPWGMAGCVLGRNHAHVLSHLKIAVSDLSFGLVGYCFIVLELFCL